MSEFTILPAIDLKDGRCVRLRQGKAEDVDRAWAQIGPYMLHDAQMYAAWMGESGSISKSVARDVESLRRENGAYRIFTPEEAAAHVKSHGILMLQPLCGGLPPELAWPSLELLTREVLPAVREGR